MISTAVRTTRRLVRDGARIEQIIRIYVDAKIREIIWCLTWISVDFLDPYPAIRDLNNIYVRRNYICEQCITRTAYVQSYLGLYCSVLVF